MQQEVCKKSPGNQPDTIIINGSDRYVHLELSNIKRNQYQELEKFKELNIKTWKQNYSCGNYIEKGTLNGFQGWKKNVAI